MVIKTVLQPPYSRDLAPRVFWLFPKLKENRYETIEEMSEAVTKVIDMVTQNDFHGAFQKLLERYNKCIAAGEDYFEGDKSSMCVLSIKVAIQKKCGNFFNNPRIYIYIYMHTYTHTHTYIHTYINIYIHTYIHIYIYMYVFTRIFISILFLGKSGIYLDRKCIQDLLKR